MNTLLSQDAATPHQDCIRYIPLTQGQFAVVDDADFDWLNQWKWHARYFKKRDKWYAVRSVKVSPFSIVMHRVIMQADKDVKIDHKDGNSLNNSRSNLRPATNGENLRNSKMYRTNTSGYRGVTVHKNGTCTAAICTDYQSTYLGTFSTKEDAARAYNEAAKKQHGEFARLNQV